MQKLIQTLCQKILHNQSHPNGARKGHTPGLSVNEMRDAIELIITSSPSQENDILFSAFLTALAMKELTSEEIRGGIEAMRNAALSWPPKEYNKEYNKEYKESLGNIKLCDTCGTGGDNSNTINISTLSAILLASLDSKTLVAKHGNRSVSSKIGSADLLEQLGINIQREPQGCISDLKELGICFLFAPLWHPAMKNVRSIRSTLAFRTIFNILGPLSNPAPVNYQCLGVYDKSLVLNMAQALAGIGIEGAYVFSSTDGLDEVSPIAPTYCVQIKESQVVKERYIEPSDFGFEMKPRSSFHELQVTNKQEAIDLALLILEGKGSKIANECIAMNAALMHSMLEDSGNLKRSAKICLDALVSGEAFSLLKKWQEYSALESEISLVHFQK